jgi:hypothetical protein
MRSTRESQPPKEFGSSMPQRQPATDRELCFKIERRLGQISLLIRADAFDEVKTLGLFKEIAHLLPARLPPGEIEPRTGLPSGDLSSAHSKLSRIISRLDPSRDSKEYAFSVPLVGACRETIQHLRECLAPTAQRSPGSSATTDIAQLRAPASQKRRS